MKRFLAQHHRLLFYFSWLAINLVQAAATELLDDEAYYWVYSKFLDWGYFDHPPMIAVLIKLGYFVFPNEFGVRILIALMSTATLIIIEQLTRVKNSFLFYAIVCSLAAIQLGGFIAVPDIPLLFFSALFFFLYQRFLAQRTTWNSVLLGLCMAMMMYSKYQSVLIILFTLGSNLSLLKSRHAYLAFLIALLAYSPHLIWQFNHEFPPLQFHFMERNSEPYRVHHTIQYLVSLILFTGPLAGILLMWGTFKHRPVGKLERALQVTTLGTLIFFLLMTIKGSVEVNWIVPALIGVMVLSHQYFIKKPAARKWILGMSAATVGLVLLVRIYAVVDFLPHVKIKEDEFHHNKSWAHGIKRAVGNLPVIFEDSYMRASKYWFYAGVPAFSLNTFDYRRNNFNFWHLDYDFLNKAAYAVYFGGRNPIYSDEIETQKGVFQGKRVESYYAFSQIRISIDSFQVTHPNQIGARLNFELDSLSMQMIRAPYDTLPVVMGIYKDEQLLQILPTQIKLGDLKSSQTHLIRLEANLPQGKYQSRFGILTCLPGAPSLNSTLVHFYID